MQNNKEKYKDKGITIYQGDCFDILSDVQDKSIDMILTDPPYGTTACEWDTCPPWGKLFSEFWRVLKKNGVICIFSQNPLAAEIICQEKKSYKYEWVWEKGRATGFLASKKRPMRAHELVLVFARGRMTYNALPINNQRAEPYICSDHGYSRNVYGFNGKIRATGSGDGRRYPRDVVFAKSVSTNFRKHPTQKPLPLLEMLIGQYTNHGETVLDPFAGSGSTLRAAQLTNRRAIGIELNPDYYAKAVTWLASGELSSDKLIHESQLTLTL